MPDYTDLLRVLEPIMAHLKGFDTTQPDAAEVLNHTLPLGCPALQPVEAMVRQGLSEGWLCPRGEDGMRYGRVCKAPEDGAGYSIDAVDMTRPGPGHEHPSGEIDLCFSIDGAPRFDGHEPGWTVYPPGSWHIPTVAGGRMAILYFLPEGQIRFGPRKAG